MKALLVTREQKRPIGIIDIGHQAEEYFRMCQTIEIHTATPVEPLFRDDQNYRAKVSEGHPFVGSYIRGLGDTELLLMIFSLRNDTEKLLVEYFSRFASGDHDAILSLKINSPIVSILGYLRR